MDLAGLPGTNKKQACNELEPTFRKPFSPIATKEPSKTNNVTELDKKYDMLQKTIQNNTTIFTTPTKPTTIFSSEVENQTPQKHIIPTLLPSTPYTPSAPMQTTMTPAIKEMVPEEVIEYSFEERRAGFVLPRAQVKTLTEV